MSALLSRVRRLGLRWRLAGWVAALILACLAIAFVAVYRGTGTQVRRQIDVEIAGDAGELARSLVSSDPRSSAQASKDATRDIHAQPFSGSSTLLFAVVPGAGTSTNVPELFGSQPPDNGETSADQEQEDRQSARLLTARTGYSTLPLPDVGELRLFKRTVHLRGGPKLGDVVVAVGEPLLPVARAQRGVARAFILAGVLALAGAMLGAWLIGTHMSRPLRRMAALAARVDAGELAPRIHDTGQAGETRVLADAFNHMLDRLTEAFAAQRAFVADASHELRTPLTVIRGQLEVLASQRQPPEEEIRRVESLVQAEITRMSRLVDDLLLLAKAEQQQFLRRRPIDVHAFVAELWLATTILADRRFELHDVPEGLLLADPDRLAQALRNLLANAIEHTAAGDGIVLMQVQRVSGGHIRFIVADDGPGIPPAQRARVFDRFHRTDAARDRTSGGTGLGLAIVDAIVKAHGGRVRAGESHAGGAQVEFELPHFYEREKGPSSPATMPSTASE